jgi:sporulation protein YlmC with PRC-barrel domain
MLVAFALAAFSAFSIALADDTTPENAVKLTESEMIFQSSKLGDLHVYNQDNQNDKLGKVDDLLINAHTGHVLYGVLDSGFGRKHVPVPWNAFRLHKDVGDNKYWLTLNKTKDELANAPTFDKKHVPDFTDLQWKKSVDDFFGVQTVARHEAAGRPGELSAKEMIFLSSKLDDLNVYNRNDTSKKLGGLDDLIVNAHTGQVLFGILDTGVVRKDIPVPWNAFQLQKKADADDYWLTLNKTSEELANAPTFDRNKMSDFADATWQQTVESFFGVRTAARPEHPER